MELEHSFTVPVPPEQAWQVLLDVERIAPCMPGATVDSVDGDVVSGRIKVKVGPVTMTYSGTGRFTERDEQARSVTLEAAGKEIRGGGTAAATVRSTLRPEDGQTRVDVATSLSVTGRPAQFGRGVMAEVGAKIIEKFAANLAAELASAGQPSAGQAATEAVPHDGVQARSNGTGPAASVPRLAAPAQGSMALPIEGLNLPVRAFNTLRREGIHTVGDLTARTEPELLAFTNLGPQSVREICEKLSGLGLSLAATAEPGQADTATGVAQKLMAEAAGDTRGRIPVTDTAVTDMAQPPPPRPFRTADEEAIDLLRVAGFPVAKRLAPAVGASVALLLVYLGARRRRRRHRATRVGDGLH